MIPVFVFAGMRRSGSHFCMHRVLSSIVIDGPRDFGIHINSFGVGLLNRRSSAVDIPKVVAYRKQNHFYTDEARPSPRTGQSDPVYMDAAYAWMTGQQDAFKLNPSGLRMAFIAINFEDANVASVREIASRIINAMPKLSASMADCPVFVSLRALRSVALSRKKWIERYGLRNIMSSRFKQTDEAVWLDHYRSVSSGSAVGLHYADCVRTKGKSAVSAFAEFASRAVRVRPSPPPWVDGSVLSDGYGSSFVGSGATKGDAVEASLRSRACRLAEFECLLERHPEARQHAERFGEL